MTAEATPMLQAAPCTILLLFSARRLLHVEALRSPHSTWSARKKLNSPADAVARLNRAAPRIKTVVIGGAGRDLTIAQTETVNNTILQFLASRPVQSRSGQ
jgi:hypothetical protein